MIDRSILHVDMDAFFASIEQRDDPSLRGKPIVVGGDPNGRGVVATASYEARRYGVKSAMACKRAKSLCSSIVFVPVNMAKYKATSQQLHAIFNRYSHRIEPISLDEAFIDVTGQDSIAIAKKIKNDIKKELNLTASVGVSYNKFLAKLASDMEKPDGFTIINKDMAMELLKPMPIRKLWGVGPKTEEQFNKLGIFTIGDLHDYDTQIILERFGKRGAELIDYAWAIDNRPVEWNEKSQSIGEENTFPKDIDDISILHKHLEEYACEIVKRIEKKKYLAQTITVKIKYEDFSIESRSLTLKYPTNELKEIQKAAHYILENKFHLKKKVRLLGISVSNFIYPHEPIQLKLDVDKYIKGGGSYASDY